MTIVVEYVKKSLGNGSSVMDKPKAAKSEKMIVLIVDDNSFYSELLVEAFEKYDVFEMLPPAYNGYQALETIYSQKVDCVVLDLIMPYMDGLTMMERLQEIPPTHVPSIIINTMIDHQTFIDKALSLGASYYLIKAKGDTFAQTNLVVKRVLDVKNIVSEPKGGISANDVVMENYISGILKEIGVPPHLLGYHYLRAVLMIAAKQPGIHRTITTKLYPAVAQKFDSTPERVERSIRHAIEVAWDRGRLETLEKYFGYTIKENKGKPTNGEFIAMIADNIQIALNKGKSQSEKIDLCMEE